MNYLPPPRVEVMELTAASAAAQQQHEWMLLELQAKKLASSMDVPTLPDHVRTALRQLGEPVRLFGENLANVRDRLRLELAKRKVLADRGVVVPGAEGISTATTAAEQQLQQEQPEETKYTRASPALVQAREQIAQFSLQRARARLERERAIKASYQKRQERKRKQQLENDDNFDEETITTFPDKQVTLSSMALDERCCQLYQTVSQATLAGSQYGDVRPLSAIVSDEEEGLVLAGSWSATLQCWNGLSPTLELLGQTTQAHEDRIMGVALYNNNANKNGDRQYWAASASIDLTAKLWKIQRTNAAEAMQQDDDNENKQEYSITEIAHFRGHAARLAKVAFHPQGKWLATTSFDHTWRLWDIETCSSRSSANNDDSNNASSEILLQDGHAAPVFGIDMHPDGSLCATSDFSGLVHVWDLRTGKTAQQYWGHAGRILSCQFAKTNGFQMVTAGDDGCIKVWDLRKQGRRKPAPGTTSTVQRSAPEPRRTLPAHSKLITQLQYSANDELLVSSSFDGTAKIWSTRGDWKLLQECQGHEGKVMGVACVVQGWCGSNDAGGECMAAKKNWNWGMVTCGFDKTLKLWQ